MKLFKVSVTAKQQLGTPPAIRAGRKHRQERVNIVVGNIRTMELKCENFHKLSTSQLWEKLVTDKQLKEVDQKIQIVLEI